MGDHFTVSVQRIALNHCAFHIDATVHQIHCVVADELLCSRHFQWEGGGGGADVGGGHIVSPLFIRTSVPSVPYVTQMVSLRYLLKGLVYWIEILYTGI